MKKLMNRAGLLAASFALALAVALALNAAAQTPAGAQSQMTQGSDTDGNGLIEITTSAQLNAMRWDVDGDGDQVGDGDLDSSVSVADRLTYADLLTCSQDTMTAGPTTSSCNGYELMNDISLASYADWDPIGPWQAVFNGNGFNITGLKGPSGLFNPIGAEGVVKNVNVVGASITIERDERVLAGVLAATNYGTIIGSYASGAVTVKPNSMDSGSVGGLAGRNLGKIAASVADVEVTVSSIPVGLKTRVGGFVGINYGHIHGSYAYGDVIDARSSGDRGFFARGFAVNQTDKNGKIHWSLSYGNKIVKRGDTETKSLALFAYREHDGTLVKNSCALENESEVTCPETPTPTPGATETPVPTPSPTPSPTPTSVAGTSDDVCIEPLAGSASVSGSWTTACLGANSPTNQTYYARFYTFTLDAESEVTITLSSDHARPPYLYILDGAGTDGAVRLSKGAATASSAAITETLQPGDYTIEATTYHSETPGDFTLELEIAQP